MALVLYGVYFADHVPAGGRILWQHVDTSTYHTEVKVLRIPPWRVLPLLGLAGLSLVDTSRMVVPSRAAVRAR
ncbi:hypothetical protein PV341_01570 [Streptomyces sp. PA03-1a]|nr:hypothetical protein [Streptomyces sp. PA03-1a]